jgi:AcrR family transcriptional regulator
MISRPRGRPRAYDPDVALSKAYASFHRAGFSATSLDEIATATGMNRPSLYAAFGDKHALYLRLLAEFRAGLPAMITEIFAQEKIADNLRGFYDRAIELYTANPKEPLGCLVICTATVEAVADPEIAAALRHVIEDMDGLLTQQLARAQDVGQIARYHDPLALARQITSVLHSLAVRARARQPAQILKQISHGAVDGFIAAYGSNGVAKPAAKPRRKISRS